MAACTCVTLPLPLAAELALLGQCGIMAGRHLVWSPAAGLELRSLSADSVEADAGTVGPGVPD